MTSYCRMVDGTYKLLHCPARLYGFMNYAIMLMLDDVDADDADDGDDLDYEVVQTISKAAANRMEELLDGLSTTQVGTKSIGLPKFFDGQYHIAVAKEFARKLGQNFFYGKARRKGQSYWNAWCAFSISSSSESDA